MLNWLYLRALQQQKGVWFVDRDLAKEQMESGALLAGPGDLSWFHLD